MEISYSLIKEFMHNGDIIPHCAYFIKKTKDRITKVDNISLSYGRIFEGLLLDDYNIYKEIPLKQNNDYSINIKRIYKQSELAKEEFKERNISLIKGINIQVLIYKYINNVLCKGILDIFPTTIKYTDITNETVNIYDAICIIDIKLTASFKNPNKNAMWNNIYNKDKTQAYLYMELVNDFDFKLNNHLPEDTISLIKSIKDKEIKFFYYVADYNKPYNELRREFFEIKYGQMQRNFLIECIRKTDELIKKYDAIGWDKKTVCHSCKYCQLECELKNYIKVY